MASTCLDGDESSLSTPVATGQAKHRTAFSAASIDLGAVQENDNFEVT